MISYKLWLELAQKVGDLTNKRCRHVCDTAEIPQDQSGQSFSSFFLFSHGGKLWPMSSRLVPGLGHRHL